MPRAKCRPIRFRSFFSLVLPLFCVSAAVAQTTPPPLASHAFVPIRVTSGGVTVRVLDAQWVWPDSVETPPMFALDHRNSKNMYLVVWYDVSPASALVGTDPRHSPLYPSALLQTPDGDVEGIGDMDSTRGPDVRRVFWGEVDPHQTTLGLRFEVIRPDAPPGAGGDVDQDAEFPALPLPPGPDVPVTVTKTLITPNGTRVFVNTIHYAKRFVFSHQRGVPPVAEQDLAIDGHWEPPPAHPDVTAEVAMPDWWSRRPGGTPSGVEDDQGENLELDRVRDRFDTISGGPQGHFTIRAHAPAVGAKTVTVRLQLREHAPSLRDASAFRRFAVTLPGAAIGLPPLRPVSGPTTPVATQPLGDGTLAVERITDAAKTGGDYHLWLRLAAPWPQTHAREWVSTQTQWRDIRSDTISGGGSLREGLFWTAEGQPLPPGDKRYDFETPMYPSDHSKPPTQVQFQLDWAEIVRRTIPMAFHAIPIPALGTVTALNRPLPETFGAFTLRKVGRFDATHPLSQGNAASLPNLDPASGLVVVLQCPPVTLAPRMFYSQPDREIELAVADARDDHGFPLLRGNVNIVRSYFVAQDALADVGGAVPNAVTLYFLSPPPTAKFFRFDLIATHQQTVRRDTTAFPALALPPWPTPAGVPRP